MTLYATVEQNGTHLKRDLTIAQRHGKVYEIHACFPNSGDYHLRIYSKRKGQERSDQMQWALGYRVKSTHEVKACQTYPSTFQSFQDHAVYLSSPLTGRLQSNSQQHFQLLVPGASDVYVMTGDQRILLDSQGDQFSGNILPQPGDLILFAKFPDQQKLMGLLQYQVE